jgi:uncharacterized protein
MHSTKSLFTPILANTAIVGLMILLSSCTPAPQEPARVESLSSTSVIVTTGMTNETPKSEVMTGASKTPLPDYLRHELTGTGLEFVRVLDDNSAYTRYQISYFSDGLRISGIMNIPKGDGEYPLVILNHGHIDTSVYTLGRGLKREQDYIARRGFAVLHTDYRNHAFSDKDLSIIEEKTLRRSAKYGSDSINAIIAVREAVKSWVKELANVDPERVGMLGHSMGGGVTMYSLVTHPDLIDAAVLYAPVHSNEYYNFQKWMRPRLSKTEYSNLEKEFWNLSNSGTFLPISPEGYLSRIKTPIQMYWGTADDSCPIEWARYMDPTFREAGVDMEYIEYAGEGHEFSREWTSFMEGVVKFFKEEL